MNIMLLSISGKSKKYKNELQVKKPRNMDLIKLLWLVSSYFYYGSEIQTKLNLTFVTYFNISIKLHLRNSEKKMIQASNCSGLNPKSWFSLSLIKSLSLEFIFTILAFSSYITENWNHNNLVQTIWRFISY